uniref:Response regulator n=1 Tax=Candidatus Desulfatibia profunda TaxID=2841695 RepID=A0A8J6TP26_9BACT|nr:response regulator [Candidatus Desulfatibia profunda]
MKSKFSILIADRNPHVREFLKREMTAEGYRVQLVENGRQLIKWVFDKESFDLLIVDPDLPDTDMPSLLTTLRDRVPLIPMVVHAFLSDYADHSDMLQEIPFVEKRGSSVEHLKKVVFEILHKYDTDDQESQKSDSPYPAER